MADISNPDGPQGDLKDPVAEQGTTDEPHEEPTFGVGPGVRPTNTQIDNPGTTETEEQRRQRGKDRREWTAFLLSIAAFVVSFGSCYGSNRSANIAERALKTTTENFKLDQRAWVGQKTVTAPPEIKSGAVFTTVLVNSGKTSALRLRGITNVQSCPKGDPFVPFYLRTPRNSRSSVAVLPREGNMNFPSPSLTLTAEQAETITSGKHVLYLHGEVEYDDVFGVTHCTTFCNFLTPDMKTTGPCATYNEVTDTKCKNIE